MPADGPCGHRDQTSTCAPGAEQPPGSPPRYLGANVYWLGLDDAGGAVHAPTAFRVRDVLESAAGIGLNLIRSHLLISSAPVVGAIRPAPFTYDEQALRRADRVLALCGELGLRLVLPLTDEWSYYHGGRRDFTRAHGLAPERFYDHPAARRDFADFVRTILRRRNTLTGIRYGEDPSVLAWETGNELRDAPDAWTRDVARLLHEHAPGHLVAAGSRSGIPDGLLGIEEVDMIDVHAYPPRAEQVLADAHRAQAAGKQFLLGEFDSRACRTDLLPRLAADPAVTGMAFWSLFGRADRGGLAANDDGFALHIPGRDTDARERVAGLQRCAASLGLRPRVLGPPATPLILAVESDPRYPTVAHVRFRGARGAEGYLLQHRSELGSEQAREQGCEQGREQRWVETTGIVVPPDSAELVDPEAVPGRRYRVVPARSAGALLALAS